MKPMHHAVSTLRPMLHQKPESLRRWEAQAEGGASVNKSIRGTTCWATQGPDHRGLMQATQGQEA